MKKCYLEPEVEVRKYRAFERDILTDSNPEAGSNSDPNDLNNDSNYDYFGGGN